MNETARRLFDDTDPEALEGALPSRLVVERILEDGDRADLAWLFAAAGAPRIRRFLAADGHRLSARSRAFWSAVLSAPAGAPSPLARSLWPLA